MSNAYAASATCMARANGTQNLDQKVTLQVIMSLLWADTNKFIDGKHCVTSPFEVMWWLYDWIIYFVPTLLSSWTLKGCDEVNEINSFCVWVFCCCFRCCVVQTTEWTMAQFPTTFTGQYESALRDGQDYIVNYIFISDLTAHCYIHPL